MPKGRKGKSNLRPGRRDSKYDIATPAYRRLERLSMRPDDSLFIAAVIGSASLFAWLVSIL
jgi:hypothetical protein